MDYKIEFLQRILGAKSIIITVLNHYLEDITEDIDELDMLELFKQLCVELRLTDIGYSYLEEILSGLNEFRKNRDQSITFNMLNTIEEKCASYVNWVFNNLDCFSNGEDNRFYLAN